MRQCRWLELVKDYDIDILYHPGKTNRVANVLSRKSSATLLSLAAMSPPLQKEITDFGLELIVGQLSTMTLESTLLGDIQTAQEQDPEIQRIKQGLAESEGGEFRISDSGVLYFGDRLCSGSGGTTEENPRRGSQDSLCDASWLHQNVPGHEETFLVAWDEKRRR